MERRRTGGEAAGRPGGRIVVIGPVAERRMVESIELPPGELLVSLGIDGMGLGDLRTGTRLRVGLAVVLDLGGAPDVPPVAPRGEPGRVDGVAVIWEPAGARVCARVVAGGSVRLADPVVVEAVPLPIEDSLDLHPFLPAEIGSLVETYLAKARAAGFREVRIIHGRGRGVQRETVRRLVAVMPGVAGFADAPPERGGWGATVVRLRLPCWEGPP